MNCEQALAEAGARLQATSDTARLDAELLLAHVLGKSRTWLYTWPEHPVSDAQLVQFQALVERRLGGEPVAHLLGEREFWSLSLKVSAATLIPRPETELLVEQALALIPPGADWRITDLGVGSGAIALAMAHECPHCRVVGVERSAAALAVAEENRRQLQLDNVSLRAGSWFEPLVSERFELIVSNPPYIATADPHLHQGDVRFEPTTALASGEDGLDDIRHIIANAGEHLQPGGWLMLEHGYDQGEAVCALLRQHGFVEVADIADLQGHGRVAKGRWAALA